jgi:ribA/ribD-fused uncharacterized protein
MDSTDINDLEALQRAVRRALRPTYLFFWGHTAKTNRGAIGKECLSQWYGAPFTLDGRTFPTAEHYMMFRKAALFGDHATADRILAAPSPGAVKALGRTAQGFVQSVWDEARLSIVATGNEAKFRQNPELRGFLTATKDKVLVEASPSDRIWGIGLAEDDSRATNPLEWRGLNLLGFALMIARGRLVDGPA